MAQLQIRLPDGSYRGVEAGSTFSDLALQIGSGLARAVIAVKVNGQIRDLSRKITQDCEVEFIKIDSDDGLEVLRHSTAHVLAMAVQKLWPKTKVTIGPVIKDGFFYDFEFEPTFKLGEKDLALIEKEMENIVAKKFKIECKKLEKHEALKTFAQINESYKTELIESFPEGEDITIYEMGGWFDLCRGPHLPSLDKMGAFKLTSIAGAYWRGNSDNTMLTRIYGTAWANKKHLQEYLDRIEEAKKRDHRVLGKQLDLFSFHDEAAANVFFHEKGAFIYQKLVAYARKVNEAFGFKEVNTPLVMNVDLWHKSGHYENYKENMYFTQVDEDVAAIKPMNCPGHCLIYGNRLRSYRELPLKLSEFGRVHRHEKSGVVNGLFRVRSFVQDDAHIFCDPKDLGEMISLVLKQIEVIYTGLGFSKYHIELSTRPAKSIGSDEMWEKAESALKDALSLNNKEYKLNPGDGAFYGPKIDFHLVDALSRSWQCGTVQVDFSMPERFALEYIGKENKPERPVMIHRAVLGSLERFLGIFIEHCAGHFPLWMSPTQVRIVTITSEQETFAKYVNDELRSSGIRCEMDLRSEKLGYKIREAQLGKVPYMVVLGKEEAETGKVNARFRDGSQIPAMAINDLIARIKEDCGEYWTL